VTPGRKWLLLGTAGLTLPLVLLLMLVLGLFALLSTESGSRWLVSKSLAVVPVDIHIEKFDGALIDGFSIRGLALTTDAMVLKVDALESAWKLNSLLVGRFVLSRFNASGVDLTLKAAGSDEPEVAGPWPSLSIGIPISIRQADIRQLHITQPEGDEIVLERIQLGASQGPIFTRIDQLLVEYAGHQARLAGRLRNRPPYAMDLRLDLTGGWPPYAPEFDGFISVKGGLDRPAIQISTRLPSPVDIKGTLETGFDASTTALDFRQFRIAAQASWQQLVVPPQLLSLPVTSGGDLNVEGSFAAYSVSGALEVKPGDFPGTDKTGPALPSAAIELALTGSASGVSIQSLTLATDAGQLQARGNVDWQPQLLWNLDIDLDRFNPGAFQSDWPGEISGHFSTNGRVSADSLLASLDIDRMSGHLRQYPLDASGNFSYDGASLKTPGFRLNLEQNRIALNGSLALSSSQGDGKSPINGDNLMAFDWQIDAANLAALAPGLSGQLQSTGNARGTLTRPAVTAAIVAENLGFQEYRADKLNLTLAPDAFKANNVELALKAQGLTAPGQQRVDLDFDWRGNVTDHSMELNLQGDGLSAKLAASGGLQDSRWTGQLQRAEFSELRAGYWRLLDTAPVSIGTDVVNLSGLCLEQQVQRPSTHADTPAANAAPANTDATPAGEETSKGQFCSDIAWQQQQGVLAQGQLQHMNLAFLDPWLPVTTSVKSELSGEFSIQGLPPALTGKINLRADAGEFIDQRTAGEVDRYPFGGLTLEGEGDLEKWQTRLEFLLPGEGILSGNLDYGIKTGELAGKINVDFSSLEWFGIFFPGLDQFAGTFTAELGISGNATAPDIAGFIRLGDFGAQVPDLGIQLQQGQFELRRQGTEPWQISSSLHSGKGKLAATGTVDWQWQEGWLAQMKLVGDRFQAVDLPELSLQANPEIDLRADPKKLSITGKLTIPAANVVINKLPDSAVAVSGDAIVVEDESQVAVPGQTEPWQIHSKVRLILGEDVHFSGFGITSGLTGNLTLVEKPGKPTQVDGEVQVLEGTYKAYGQLLDIEEGRLIFRGPPENPGLSVRAVRYYENTKVGISIGGTASDLRSEIFSEPALPTSEAMAILLTGKPLERASKSEAVKLSDAAAALGISQSKYVTQRLQSALGVDVLKLNSGDTLEESSLIVGKYLSPRLYVSYVKDLFNPGALVNLEYKMGKRFKLKAEAGAQQSIDLLYSIDR